MINDKVKYITYSHGLTTDVFNKILKKTSSPPSYAPINYSNSINKGLICNIFNKNLEVIIVPTFGVFPITKILFFKPKKFFIKRIKFSYVFIINLFIIKQLLITVELFIKTFTWAIKNILRRKIIIVQGINTPFLLSASISKFIFKSKIILFLPDLPDFMYSYTKEKSILKSNFYKLDILILNYLINKADFFVPINSYIKDSFLKGKHSFVINGFINNDCFVKKESFNKINGKKYVMYAGALFEKYGVKQLIDAFRLIDRDDIIFWIFGSGDLQEYVIDVASKDDRIIYFGNVDNDVVLSYELEADLLVNPRFSTDEYTKFSFPSKILEYMHSGTPVLTTRLDCFGKEYDDHLYFFKDETLSGFSEDINYILSKKSSELIDFGKAAKEFVLKNNNPDIQIKMLLQVYHNCINNHN